MKKILSRSLANRFLAIIAFVGLLIQSSFAAPYLEEPFAYASGNLAGQGGWSGGSGSQVAAGSLSYAGLQSPTVTSNKASLPVTASTAFKSFAASPITNGSVYLSFILKQTTLASSTGGSTLAGFDDDGTVTTTSGQVAAALGIHLKQTNTTQYLVGIRKGQGASGAGGGANLFYTGSSFVVGDVVFIVAKYTFGAGAGDDTVALWVNPLTNSFGGAEPVPSIAATNTGNTTDATQLQYAFVRCNSSTTSGANELDNLRVGSTWADVAPADGSAPPPATTNSQPFITQTLLSGNSLVLRGTNGSPGGVYRVVSSGDVVLPITNWPAITTNTFDTNGNFDCTNPISAADAHKFFRLLTGGQIAPPPVEPPAITLQPTNLVVIAGQNAAFTAAASGTSPLAYQWFFNTNTAVANATSPTLTLTNVQATNAGAYSLRVTNTAGSATSSVATLTVVFPPAIANQPISQSVTVNNAATFTVGASGTLPLSYQWYFNTNTPLAGATNSYWTINSATTNDAGAYSVIVTNAYGAATSTVASLTVNLPGSAPDFSMMGFATLSGFTSNGTYQAGGTTGGAAGPLVVASNLTWLVNFAERSNMPLRILVTSNVDCSSLANHHGGFPAGYPTGEILISSNKTIYSTNGVTISRGTFRIGKASNGKDNIIIRNLKFRDLWVYDSSGNYDTYGWDYIGLEGGSHHVWIDHCDFEQVYDGMVDVVHASDYVTVSWNVFRTQKKCSLVGHSDSNASEDTGHLNVTFHHNYYVDVDERMPRMRFGNAHVFNLYCENLGGNGIQSTCDAATLVENSYFYHPQSGSLPTREENGGPSGIIKVVNSTIVNLPGVNVQFRQFGETNFLFNAPFVGANPPYPYTPDPLNSTPGIVTNWAGVGKLTSF